MRPTHVLFVGASGSVGRYAVREGVARGYRVRALDGIDGIVFTMGANGGPTLNEDVDYGAAKNALASGRLSRRPVPRRMERA